MPVTPIGKIYKPALRVLATRRAIEEALDAIGLGPAQFDIAVGKSESVVRLNNFAREEAVKGALLGMPIRYRIEAGTRSGPR
jgi:fatty-acyl-CoA synthase